MTLKLLVAFITILLISPPAYYVSHVNGKIIHYPGGRPLITGERITDKDSLIFVSSDAWASVVSPTAGRFILYRRKTIETVHVSNLIAVINENLEPVVSTANMAGRGGFVNTVDEIPLFLRAQSGVDTAQLLLADSITIPLNAVKFDDREQKFFYIQGRCQGQIVNKRLVFREKDASTVLLIIDKAIYKVGEKPVGPAEFQDLQLYYYNQKQKKSYLVTNLVIYTPTHEQLSAEIRVLWQQLSSLYQDQADRNSMVTSAICDELLREYGFIDPSSIKHYL